MRSYILLFMLLTTTLCAIEKSAYNVYNETIVAKDNYTTSNNKGTTKGTYLTYYDKLDVSYYNYINDKLFINVGAEVKYVITGDKQKTIFFNDSSKTSVWFSNLYLSYEFYRNYYISGGILSFKHGSYTEISELEGSSGTGLIDIVDVDLMGMFILNKKEVLGYNVLSKIGYGYYHDDNIKNPNGTKGIYFTVDAYKNFDTIKLNYYNIDSKYKGVNLGNVQLLGLGFNKYFLKEGINVYSTLGWNHSKINASGAKALLKNAGISSYAPLLFPKAFNFKNNVVTDGYLLNAGIAKDIDSVIVESYNIGGSYTYTTDNWYAATSSEYSDYMHYRFTNGDTYYTWFTTRFTTDIALKLFYGVTVNRNARAVGNSLKVVNFKDTPIPSLKRIERYGMKIIVRF